MDRFPTIAELGAGYRDGSLTPSGVVEQALQRLADLEPSLNAFALPMRAEARADAARCTGELKAGKELGPLHGIPVAIKDLIDVEGVATGYGSKVAPPRIAVRDATLVARLRAAGAVILGKTNLLEYAYGVAHPKIGQTNNPHDPTRTAGGSSGGSAAAVAAGIVPLAIGTDTGGSIRIPAAYCGIVGLKPSFGLVPLDGVFPLSWSLDHAGPLTRNVSDAALALACLAGREVPVDPVMLGDIRVGIMRQQVSGTEIGHAVTKQFEQILARLRRAGVSLRDIEVPGLEDANQALVTILLPEASVIHENLYATNAAGYADRTRSQIEAGAKVPAADYVKARRFQHELRERIEAAFDTVDVLIAPSVPFVAPTEDPEIAEGEDSEMLASGLANLTGHPALSLPCGMVAGMPVGMQMIGPLGRDAPLISMATAFESNPEFRSEAVPAHVESKWE